MNNPTPDINPNLIDLHRK